MKEKSQKKIQVCKLGSFQVTDWRERLCLIAQVWYIKLLTRLRGLRDIIANFSQIQCFVIPRRDLSTKKTKLNIEKWPESLWVVLEFWTWATVTTFLVLFLCKSLHDIPYLLGYKRNPKLWTGRISRVCKFFWWLESLWLLLHKILESFWNIWSQVSHFQTFQHVRKVA